ncbi:MAG: hypothetical protein K0Q91_873 [Fibrobacteria bacterium]|nr:hypothetical protein [Fibrobacteria bacterium]
MNFTPDLRSLRAAALMAALAFLSGCAPYVTSITARDGFSVTDVSKARSVVVTTPLPVVSAFEGSYEAAYGTGDSLSFAVSHGIATALGDSVARVMASTPENETFLNALQTDETAPYAPAHAFLAGLGAKYLVHVRGVNVTQRFVYSYNGGSQTICMVVLNVEIWDSETRTKQIAFTTTGESGVFLFAFQTALKNAVARAGALTGKYIATGHPGP